MLYYRLRGMTKHLWASIHKIIHTKFSNSTKTLEFKEVILSGLVSFSLVSTFEHLPLEINTRGRNGADPKQNRGGHL